MPVEYRITVRGRLSRDLIASFEDATVRPIDGVTILTGTAVDRAQLDGILDRLRSMGIEVVNFSTGEGSTRRDEHPEQNGGAT